MKVMELCLSPDLGGLELYMYRCVKSLSGGNDEVIAITIPGGKLAQKFESDGVAWHGFEPALRALPLVSARRLAALIDREGVDVIHMHWAKDLPLAALAKSLSERKPALAFTRQMQITRPKRDLYHDFLYRQVDSNIAITRVLADDLRRFLPADLSDRVDYLYYGVAAPKRWPDAAERTQLRTSLGVPADAFLVGLIGRIKHYKGQHLLLDALEQGVREGETMYALIVGRAMEDEYLTALKQRVASGVLAGKVIFRDFIDQPQVLMQACDCVALTTIEETFGLVLVEAMRAGVAVVGSDRGGVPEIIDHLETGMLFRSGDAHSFYQALFSLKNDPSARARIAAAGKEKADRLFAEENHFVELRSRLARLTGNSVP